MRKATITLAMALVLVGEGGPAIAEDDSGTVVGAGLQAASWLATVPYGAVKIVYAIGGGVVGGLAWLMTAGNMTIAKAIWEPTMTGHYIVEPRNLTGEKPLHFMGAPSEYPSPASPDTTP
jgi:hypothetical protein